MSPEMNSGGAMDNYTEAEMLRMQRDAIRRVREMQNRARDFEQARRAATGGSDPLIPRPVLTGNPIGSGLTGHASPSAAQPNVYQQPSGYEQLPPLQELPPLQYQQIPQQPQSPRGPAYPQGGQQPAPGQPGGLFGSLLGGSGQSGGILGSLFGGQGIGGIGNGINQVIDGFSAPVRGALDSPGLDNERLLIILVMFLVFTQEEYDNLLLLALGYLLF